MGDDAAGVVGDDETEPSFHDPKPHEELAFLNTEKPKLISANSPLAAKLL